MEKLKNIPKHGKSLINIPRVQNKKKDELVMEWNRANQGLVKNHKCSSVFHVFCTGCCYISRHRSEKTLENLCLTCDLN